MSIDTIDRNRRILPGGPVRQETPHTVMRQELGPDADLEVASAEGMRRFSIYAPRAAFDLVDELDFLTSRSIDQNVFFTPQFLVPAMPRLDDRSVKLMVVRDEAADRSRLRLLMPYSIERAGLLLGPKTIRAWAHPFGPLGTPLVDGDDPATTVESLLRALARPELGLADVLVLPDLRIDEPFARTVLGVAARLGLPVERVNAFDRAVLMRKPGEENGIARSLSPKRRREVQRQRRLLETQGTVSFDVARGTTDVRRAMEEFLSLEASGWKGRERSALMLDRYRAAFAREAVDALAAKDRVRIFTLRLDGRPIAALVAFVLNGEAFTWKMAYDEAQGPASPGLQMMIAASDALMAEPDVSRADSCAVPDHALMNKVWKDRIAIATLVVGLTPAAAERAAAAARGLAQVRNARNRARLLRQRVRTLLHRTR